MSVIRAGRLVELVVGTRYLDPGMLDLLKRNSRSFYLSLRFLPAATRGQIALAYLLARAADTIADTPAVPLSERRQWLQAFKDRLADPTQTGILGIHRLAANGVLSDSEKDLLGRLEAIFRAFDRLEPADARRTRQLLVTIIDGMILDQTWFPGQSPADLRALASRQDLQLYCYHVAGVVGEYWTDMHAAHLSGLRVHAERLRPLGVRFGLGLQMTNILRDIPRDLKRGRCYLPGLDLAHLGVEPGELVDPRALARVRPLVDELLTRTASDLQAGFDYVTGIPHRYFQLRLCCVWPLLIGMQTLGLVKRSANLLDPSSTLKISRPDVYRLMAESTARCWSKRLLGDMWSRLADQAGCSKTPD